MEPFPGIHFDGHFYADVAEGGMTLLSEISFTATLNYVISDQSKLNTMFGGQLPVDILKREASLSVERAFTKLFEGGCSLDELKYKTATQASAVLQESNFSDWEGSRGVFEDAGAADRMDALLKDETARRSWEALTGAWAQGG